MYSIQRQITKTHMDSTQAHPGNPQCMQRQSARGQYSTQQTPPGAHHSKHRSPNGAGSHRHMGRHTLCAHVKTCAPNTLDIVHSRTTLRTALTLTVRAQVHMHPEHWEFSQCFYEGKEREARNGVGEEKGVERWKRGQGNKGERGATRG